MAKASYKYVCSNCGYTSSEPIGKCPNCGQWDTLKKVYTAPVSSSSAGHRTIASRPTVKVRHKNWRGNSNSPKTLNEISSKQEPRTSTGSEEFDRVLGGGIVRGSLTLLGGNPGIGKSTLLLQVASNLSNTGKKILYVSGEESLNQIKLRATRLGIKSNNNLFIYTEINMDKIKNAINQVNPDLLVIDSIQTMQEPDVDSAIGSIAQVRRVTADLMQIAKSDGLSTFIVGHITKSGTIAGPKTLEHMVDTVLYFGGDMHHTYRILRSVKNRFGSTDELGVFEMRTGGLVEVKNPSKIFLEERLKNATGSAVVASMQGTRPILVEIQALVAPSIFGYAQRTASGISRNRVSLLMAVLEKRAGLMLQNQDAYLKIAGGVQLKEPAIDLATAVSIASSFKNVPTDPEECYIGEIGLTGEIRRVTHIKQRVAEARRLGFKRILVPRYNIGGWTFPSGIKVIGVTTINQALRIALGIGSSKYHHSYHKKSKK